MDEIKVFAPTIPLPILLMLTVVSAGILAVALRRMVSWPGRVALLAIWLRLMFNAYPFITIRPILPGITVNAVLSVATIAAALAAMDRRKLLMVWMWPLYALLGVVAISQLVNGDLASGFDLMLRFSYLIVLTCLVASALDREGLQSFSAATLIVLSVLVLLQIAAVGLGLQKLSEADQSIAYVGGMGHEANYSLALGIGLPALVCATGLTIWQRLVIFAAGGGTLALANYRTAILAYAPALIITFLGLYLAKLSNRWKAVAIVAGLFVALMGAALTPSVEVGDRWGEVVKIAENPIAIIRPPEDFTQVDRSEASGRFYLFSVYYYAWARSDSVRMLIGHGAESWKDMMAVYAQNTLFQYLFELGLLGALAVVCYWVVLTWLALRAPPAYRYQLLALNVGMVILNMSTMPMTLLEGLQLYAVLGGYLAYLAGRPSIAAPAKWRADRSYSRLSMARSSA